VRRARGIGLGAALALLLGACSASSGGGPGGVGPGGVDASGEGSAPADASSGTDAAHDVGASGADGAGGALDGGPTDAVADAQEAAPAPTCGPPPNRFTILNGADAGLVRDNVTQLVWMHDSVGGQQTSQQTQPLASTYCTGRGMRLPTEDEALALAAAYASCAFGQWGTWTSTDVAGSGDAWVVDYLGDASPQLADNFPSAVLCVRDPKG